MPTLRRVLSDLKKGRRFVSAGTQLSYVQSFLEQKKPLPPLVYHQRHKEQDEKDQKEVWSELRTDELDGRIHWLKDGIEKNEEKLKTMKENSEEYRDTQMRIWRDRKQLRRDAEDYRREWQRELDRGEFWSKPEYNKDPRFKFFLDVVHSTSKEDSLRRADAQATLDGAARWLRGQHDASNAWLDEPTAKLHDLSLSDRESAPRPFPTRTSSLKPPSSALWDKGDGPMSRGRSLNTVPQVRSAPLGRDMLKRRSNSVNGAEELTLARSPSRLGKALGRARSKSRVRRLEGKRMLLE